MASFRGPSAGGYRHRRSREIGATYGETGAAGFKDFGDFGRKSSRRLFNYLGMTDPGDRRAFRQAAGSGSLNQFFADRPSSMNLYQQLLGADGNPYSGRKGRRRERTQDLARYYATQGGYDPSLISPTGEVSPYDNAPPYDPNPPGPAPGTGFPDLSTLEEMLQKMGGFLGPTGTGMNDVINDRLEALGEGPPLPAYEDMFNTIMQITRREGDRNIAALNEGFGSQGARYGSDIMRAQGDMRRDQTMDTANFANELALRLRGARTAEQDSLLGQQAGAAQLEQQARETAMQRMFQEYMMQQQLPPYLQALLGMQPPTEDTISYVS